MLNDREARVEAMEETPSDSEEQKQIFEAPKPETFVDRLKYITWVSPQAFLSYHTFQVLGRIRISRLFTRSRFSMFPYLSSVIFESANNMIQANYTFPMATGGLALLLSPESQPHSFNGLEVIGKIIYIFDIVIFSIITAIITYRFWRYPKTLKRSLLHPTESLFSATFLLACAGIITCIGRYGVPACGEWLVVVYSVLFWAYFAVTLCTGVGHYVLLFTSPRLKIQDMTPAWGKETEALLLPSSMLTSA
jgi:hypothetical protein